MVLFCLPGYGAVLALIGLPLACISKRRSSIVLNVLGLIIGILVFIGFVLLIAYGMDDFFMDPFFEPF